MTTLKLYNQPIILKMNAKKKKKDNNITIMTRTEVQNTQTGESMKKEKFN